MYTRKEICKEFDIQISTFDKISEYLKLNPTKEYHEKARKVINVYSENDYALILNFLNDNPNTRQFFSNLSKIEKYGSLENYYKQKSEKTKQTKLERYGDENYCNSEKISQSKKESWSKDKEEILDKIKETKLEKYGNENYNNSQKMRITKRDLYGDENYNNREKFKTTIENNYGVSEFYSQNAIKTKQTKEERYGDENYRNDSQIKKTNLERYGSEVPTKNKDVSKKISDTWNNKSDDEKIRISELRKQIQSDLKNKDFDELSKLGNFISVSELTVIFDKDLSTIHKVCDKLNIERIKSNSSNYYVNESCLASLRDYFETTKSASVSFGEKEIVGFIKTVYDGEIIENDREILKGKELDIYIPNKNLAIEFDGIYYHSEMNMFNCGITDSNELSKLKNKHLDKTIACENLGIRLIHIIDIDWNNKKNIYKSIIKSALGIYDEKIYARKCEVRKIDTKCAEQFFNENHIQGYGKSSYAYGLFYNNELFQAVTFIDNKNELELNRMVTRLNTQILGGFSKLVKFAMSDMNVREIVSFIDRSLYNGKGYTALGFVVEKINIPTYKWYYKGKLYRREFSMKKNQKKRFDNHEQLYFDENKTEVQNMIDNKIPRIWNCGTIKVRLKMNDI